MALDLREHLLDTVRSAIAPAVRAALASGVPLDDVQKAIGEALAILAIGTWQNDLRQSSNPAATHRDACDAMLAIIVDDPPPPPMSPPIPLN